jgi:mono/diheme cytochrome c family protein
MKQRVFPFLAIVILLAACGQIPSASEEPTAAPGMAVEMGMGMGMGRQSGMMARHRAPIPEAYAGLVNPVTADEASLERGGELFVTHCASCHGDGAMGDGPAGTGLDPAPVPIAHTSQMMSDSYLFWRVSEGGAMEPFNSAMPAWKETLDEQARWDVLNYVQALGSGAVMPRQGLGGSAYDPAAQPTREAAMLATAVDQGVLTQAEADTFAEVHAVIEALRTQGGAGMSGNMVDMQAAILAELVDAGTITTEQADAFSDTHNRLLEAGLMK